MLPYSSIKSSTKCSYSFWKMIISLYDPNNTVDKYRMSQFFKISKSIIYQQYPSIWYETIVKNTLVKAKRTLGFSKHLSLKADFPLKNGLTLLRDVKILTG